MASYVLRITGPDNRVQSIELDKLTAVIGREVGDVVVNDPRCSSRHAEISFDGASVRIHDLKSTNGTLYRGERIETLQWPMGVSLNIGKHVLTLSEIRGAPAPGLTVIAGQTSYAPPRAAAPHSSSGLYSQLAKKLRVRNTPRTRKVALGIGVLVLLAAAGATQLRQQSRDTRRDAATMSAKDWREIPIVWINRPEKKPPYGSVSKARIRVTDNPTGRVSVGVAEEFAKSAGDQWRAATWLAAFNAARAGRVSLGQKEYSVHVDDHVDGPSAGLFMTVAMLALLRGEPFLKEPFTITGSINPDGTAGPVSGIIEKMVAARKAGLKRFGFPVGTRHHQPLDGSEGRDLMEVAKENGLTALELTDLHEAYKFATGVSLPRESAPATVEQLALEPYSQELLRAQVRLIKTRVDSALDELDSAVDNFDNQQVRAYVRANLPAIRDTSKQATRYENNDYQGAALDRYALTALELTMLRKQADSFDAMLKGKTHVLTKLIGPDKTLQSRVAALDNQLLIRPNSDTLGAQLRTAFSFQAVVEAQASLEVADAHRKAAAAERIEGQNLALSLNTWLNYLFTIFAQERLNLAQDMQGLVQDDVVKPPLPAIDLDHFVSGYASAASAVIASFEALVIQDWKRQEGIKTNGKKREMSFDEKKEEWLRQDPNYALALQALRSAEHARSDRRESQALRRLAAARMAFLGGASLLNKWHSLGAHKISADDDSVTIENRRALSAQLDRARSNALEAAGRAKAEVGFIPTAARLEFQNANATREGSDNDKLDALEAYWSSIFWSEFAVSKFSLGASDQASQL